MLKITELHTSYLGESGRKGIVFHSFCLLTVNLDSVEPKFYLITVISIQDLCIFTCIVLHRNLCKADAKPGSRPRA